MRFLSLVLFLYGCADSTSVENGEPPSIAAPTPAARTQTPPASPEPEKAVENVRIVRIGPALAEDGLGKRLQSQDAVLIDIETSGWPGQAMDPVLIVGERRFTAYTHVSPTLLRYTAERHEYLPEGTSAVVRYGNRDVAHFTLPAVEQP